MFSVTSKAAFTLPGDNRTIKPDIAKSGRLACDRCRNMQKPEPCGISRLRALPAPRVKPAGLREGFFQGFESNEYATAPERSTSLTFWDDNAPRLDTFNAWIHVLPAREMWKRKAAHAAAPKPLPRGTAASQLSAALRSAQRRWGYARFIVCDQLSQIAFPEWKFITPLHRADCRNVTKTERTRQMGQTLSYVGYVYVVRDSGAKLARADVHFLGREKTFGENRQHTDSTAKHSSIF
ncbi:hypothetical protein IEO21_08287 [Rhodonia placenta]|uniref:Uncharacterized protein n=1 Tax=Rhodonia placenta TaxID=104341 RepID=A0A8H7TYY4_9APHY|nr:hypothetical protein IEO21_08287 [Postia placenta]